MPDKLDEIVRAFDVSRLSEFARRCSEFFNECVERKPIRVLIVEDEEISATYLKGVLVRNGFEVLGTVRSGEEAVTGATWMRPDIVFMDIMLEGEMDGIAAAEEINLTTPTQILFLSSLDDKETIRRAKTTLPFGYLVKPADEQTILAMAQVGAYLIEFEKSARPELRPRLLAAKNPETFCIVCRKLQSDNGEWVDTFEHLEAHRVTRFTHGVCPSCVQARFEVKGEIR